MSSVGIVKMLLFAHFVDTENYLLILCATVCGMDRTIFFVIKHWYITLNRSFKLQHHIRLTVLHMGSCLFLDRYLRFGITWCTGSEVGVHSCALHDMHHRLSPNPCTGPHKAYYKGTLATKILSLWQMSAAGRSFIDVKEAQFSPELMLYTNRIGMASRWLKRQVLKLFTVDIFVLHNIILPLYTATREACVTATESVRVICLTTVRKIDGPGSQIKAPSYRFNRGPLCHYRNGCFLPVNSAVAV